MTTAPIPPVTAPMTTWADGYGRWHAETLDTKLARSRAVEAITSELMGDAPRWQSYAGMADYVWDNLTPVPSDKPGYVHFVEYEI